MRTLNIVLALSLLMFVASCSQKPTSSEVSISTGFALLNTSFPSGLIVYGEKLDGSRKFSATFETSNTRTITLEKGNWRLSVVGWKGNGNSNPNFDSTLGMACGSKDVNLTQNFESVDIGVQASNCAAGGAFDSNYDLKPLWITSCGVFYKYDLLTDAYSDLTAATSDNFCNNVDNSMPMMHRSPFSYYRIYAYNSIDNSLGFGSSCITATTKPGVSTLPKIPAKKFPFVVKLFKDITDCTNSSSNNKMFFFNDGISSDYNFGTDLKYSGTNNRLVLPSAFSNQGKSPFIGLIPNVLCGATGNFNDCMADPTHSFDVNVGWDNPRDVLLSKRIDTSGTCTVNSSSFDRFAIKSCSIDEKGIQAKIYRNEFLCREQTNLFSGTVLDIYQRSDYFYVLTNDGVDKLHIFDRSGVKIHTYSFPDSGRMQMAASQTASPKLFFTTASNNIQVYSFILPNIINPLGTIPLGRDLIDVNDDGSILFGTDGTILRVHNISNLSSPSPIGGSLTATGTWRQITYKAGYIYALDTTPAPSSFLYKLPLSTYSLPASTSGHIENGLTGMTNFTVDDNGYFIVFGNIVKHYDSSMAAPTSTASVVSGTVIGALTTGDMTIVGNSTGEFSAHKINGSSLGANLAMSSGSCTEPNNVTLNGVQENLTLISKKHFNTYALFNEGYRFLGRRTVNYPNSLMFFDAFHEGEKDEVRTGGNLRRIQEWLSPHGVSGILKDYANCAAVASAAPFEKDHTFFDPQTGESLGVEIDVIGSQPIDQFVCNDTDPGGSCSAVPNYDLQMTVVAKHSATSSETAIIKLSCSGKRGSFESFETKNPNKKSSYKLLWNTQDVTKARYEKYSLDTDGVNTRAEIVKVEKSGGNLVQARRIDSSIDSSSPTAQSWANASEFEINGGYTRTGNFNLNATTDDLSNLAFNPAGYAGIYSFNDIRSNNNFGALTGPFTAPACSQNLDDLSDPNSTGCNFTHGPWARHGGGDLAIEQIREPNQLIPGTNLFEDLELPW